MTSEAKGPERPTLYHENPKTHLGQATGGMVGCAVLALFGLWITYNIYFDKEIRTAILGGGNAKLNFMVFTLPVIGSGAALYGIYCCGKSACNAVSRLRKPA